MRACDVAVTENYNNNKQLKNSFNTENQFAIEIVHFIVIYGWRIAFECENIFPLSCRRSSGIMVAGDGGALIVQNTHLKQSLAVSGVKSEL